MLEVYSFHNESLNKIIQTLKGCSEPSAPRRENAYKIGFNQSSSSISKRIFCLILVTSFTLLTSLNHLHFTSSLHGVIKPKIE